MTLGAVATKPAQRECGCMDFGNVAGCWHDEGMGPHGFLYHMLFDKEIGIVI